MEDTSAISLSRNAGKGEKMNFDIAVLSYEKPKWKALRWLDDQDVPRDRIHLFLHNFEQFKKYWRGQDIKGVNIYYSHATSLAEQRVFSMRNMYPRPFVQMDDDVTGIYRFSGGEKLRQKLI